MLKQCKNRSIFTGGTLPGGRYRWFDTDGMVRGGTMPVIRSPNF